MSSKPSFATIDEYIVSFNLDLQVMLQALRTTICSAAPDAVEKISYQMPTFVQHGNLVHFAVAKQHIGFYPTPSGIEAFRDELAAYGTSKGAIRFPLGQPLPLDLISRIVRYRVAENLAKAEAKAAPKGSQR